MVGKLLAHFQLLEKLGEGGMGVVYKARDRNLGRLVAIKILPAGATSNPAYSVRFLQEARTASSLNHPNIVQIYDLGNAEGMDFIAMEYIPGCTLHQIIGQQGCKTQEILHYAIQIVDALSAAHSARILHRDLKPANIMVHERKLIKILDFGLAKLLQPAEGEEPGETMDWPGSLHTQEGRVMGTVAYMSPEQARGEELDERSDLFSFGAVLYEMATGQHAFPGNTAAVVFDAILNRTPPAPQDFNPDLPAELVRIILKAVEKDPARRYQTAREMRVDLERLQQATQPGATSAELAPASSSQSGRSKQARRPAPWIIAALVLIACIGSAVWLTFYSQSNHPSPTTVPFTSFPGGEYEPAFSPDGTRVAFVWNGEKEDNFDIYVKLVNTGAPLRLTTNPAGEGSPAWSPDGQSIAFIRYSARHEDSGVYVVPALGGPERKIGAIFPLAHIFDRHLDWSPDGKFLVVVDKASAGAPFGLFLLSPNDGDKRRLTTPPVESIGDTGPAFSPDGRTVSFNRTISSGVNDIYLVAVTGGEPRRLTQDNLFISGHAWSADGREIVFASARGGPKDLWRIPSSGGEPKSLGELGEGAYYLAISRRGNELAYSKFSRDSNIWRIELSPAGEPVQDPAKFISSTLEDTSAQYSPDGSKIAFRSNRSGSDEIWVCDSSGANPLALTSFRGVLSGTPRWSPDGQYLAFDSRPGGNPDIYVIRATGGSPRRITTEKSEDVVPSWSADGKWIYFASNRTGDWQVWKTPAEEGSTGKPVQVTRQGGFAAFESTDGKWTYYAKGRDRSGLWKVPVDGGEESEVIASLKAGYWGYWAVTDKGIYFIDLKRPSEAVVELFSFATERVKQLARLPKDPPFGDSGFSISKDGRWVLYTQVDQSGSDIMLVENFR